MATKKRKLFAITSKTDDWTESPPRWEKEYRETIACGKCLCPRKGYPFQPIPQYVMRRPEAPFCLVMNTVPHIVSEELAQTIEPYLQDVEWGPVYLERDDLMGRLPFRSYYVRPDRCIIENRSPYARHSMCGSCGVIFDGNPSAKEAVLASYLDNRLIYQTTGGMLYVDLELASTTQLAERFPLLDLFPIKVIDKPMDGDVLPGDPGWSGTLVERPIEIPDMTTPFARKWSY